MRGAHPAIELSGFPPFRIVEIALKSMDKVRKAKKIANVSIAGDMIEVLPGVLNHFGIRRWWIYNIGVTSFR